MWDWMSELRCAHGHYWVLLGNFSLLFTIDLLQLVIQVKHEVSKLSVFSLPVIILTDIGWTIYLRLRYDQPPLLQQYLQM